MGDVSCQAKDGDLLDRAVCEAAEATGGDVRTAILELVRRQHRAEGDPVARLPDRSSRAA